MGNSVGCCLNKRHDDDEMDEETGIRTNVKQFNDRNQEGHDFEELDIYLDPKFNTEFDPNITEMD